MVRAISIYDDKEAVVFGIGNIEDNKNMCDRCNSKIFLNFKQ